MPATKRCLSCLDPALPQADLTLQLRCPCSGNAPGCLQPPAAAASRSCLFTSLWQLRGKGLKAGGAGSEGRRGWSPGRQGWLHAGGWTGQLVEEQVGVAAADVAGGHGGHSVEVGEMLCEQRGGGIRTPRAGGCCLPLSHSHPCGPAASPGVVEAVPLAGDWALAVGSVVPPHGGARVVGDSVEVINGVVWEGARVVLSCCPPACQHRARAS